MLVPVLVLVRAHVLEEARAQGTKTITLTQVLERAEECLGASVLTPGIIGDFEQVEGLGLPCRTDVATSVFDTMALPSSYRYAPKVLDTLFVCHDFFALCSGISVDRESQSLKYGSH